MVLVRLLVLLLPITALAKVPITHESLWLMKRVGSPIPSPDGKLVVSAVSEPAYNESDQVSDLWVAPSDGAAAPRRITSTKGAETGVAWSPDSRSIVFIAKREGDEAAQIYLLNMTAGGEAIRMTTVAMGAAGPRFSPDGKKLLFTSAVYPGAVDEDANKAIAAEHKARKYHARVFDSFPIRQWDKWLEEPQTHLFVQDAVLGAKPKDLLAGTKLVAGAGFAGAPGSGSGDDLQAAWAPDGQSIVFAAVSDRNKSAYSEAAVQLYQIGLAGGEPKAITSGPDSHSKPVFRPDGKALYCDHSRNGEKLYSLNRIAMFAWPAIGERTLVTGNFDRSVSSYTFTPDSRSIYLSAEDASHENVYRVAAEGGTVEAVIRARSGVYTALAIGEKAEHPVLVGTWESASNPMEIVRIDPATKTHKLLTTFNVAKAAELDLAPLKEFWAGKDGKRVHSMIALPPNFDEHKKYPLFVMIHGGPHSMWRDQFVLRWNYHLMAAPGYIVLLTDYTGSTGYGEKFSQAVQGDPLRGPGLEINDAADKAIAMFPFIDATRQAAGERVMGGT